MLGLEMQAPTPSLLWVLWIPFQLLILAWQARYPLSYLLGTIAGKVLSEGQDTVALGSSADH